MIMGRYREIDDKRAFDLWMEVGNLRDAFVVYQKLAKAEGTYSPGNWNTVANAARRWIVENPLEARQKLIRYNKDRDWSNDFIWFTDLVSKSFSVFIHQMKPHAEWYYSDENEELRQKFPDLVTGRFYNRWGTDLADLQV